jgi:hypothetical protein
MPRDPQYYRQYSKDTNKENKEMRIRYHSPEANPRESFSKFKKRMKEESKI